MPELESLISPHTKVAMFRNGINLLAHFSSFVHQNNLLETIIDCPCQQIKPQVYLQSSEALIVLPSKAIANEFLKLFIIEADILSSSKFRIAQWGKLIESSSLGSIQALNQQACTLFKIDKHLKEYLELIE